MDSGGLPYTGCTPFICIIIINKLMFLVESAFNAARGGASRLEVCSSLAEGGLTPSPGLVRVITENVTIPCFALLRPRSGDFVYRCLFTMSLAPLCTD